MFTALARAIVIDPHKARTAADSLCDAGARWSASAHVERNRDRAVVDQFDLHVRTEHPSSDAVVAFARQLT